MQKFAVVVVAETTNWIVFVVVVEKRECRRENYRSQY